MCVFYTIYVFIYSLRNNIPIIITHDGVLCYLYYTHCIQCVIYSRTQMGLASEIKLPLFT